MTARVRITLTALAFALLAGVAFASYTLGAERGRVTGYDAGYRAGHTAGYGAGLNDWPAVFLTPCGAEDGGPVLPCFWDNTTPDENGLVQKNIFVRP